MSRLSPEEPRWPFPAPHVSTGKIKKNGALKIDDDLNYLIIAHASTWQETGPERMRDSYPLVMSKGRNGGWWWGYFTSWDVPASG